MANKGLIIGVVVLIAICGIAITLKKGNTPAENTVQTAESTLDNPAPVVAESAPVTVPAPENTEAETAAETTIEPSSITVPTVAEVAETVPATTETVPAVAETSLLAMPEGLDIDMKKVMSERVLGDVNAPVTVIEYASMTCPHCAYFHKDLFAGVKAKLIDTGKLLYIFRDFPLDGTAMKAAMMARCADPEKYFDLVEVIFQNQERWVKAEDPVKALTQYGRLAGMDETYINLCITSAELENNMLNKLNEGQTRYSIQQTPTFIFNGGEEKFSGAHPAEKFEEIVNKLTAGKQQ